MAFAGTPHKTRSNTEREADDLQSELAREIYSGGKAETGTASGDVYDCAVQLQRLIFEDQPSGAS
jgi:hypothetical protein